MFKLKAMFSIGLFTMSFQGIDESFGSVMISGSTALFIYEDCGVYML